MISVLVGPLLQGFFSEHLAQHRQVSFQTIASYRDTFRLLLQFVRDKKGVEPAVLTLDALDAPTILGFLESLEQQRGNCIRSRNVRLTAIRSPPPPSFESLPCRNQVAWVSLQGCRQSRSNDATSHWSAT